MRRRFGKSGAPWLGWLRDLPAVPVLPTTFVLVLILVLRAPGNLLEAQFFAEEGTVFFKQAYDAGFWRTLLDPCSGYLTLLPRIGAGLAQLVPLPAAPLLMTLVALAAQAAPVPYLLSTRLKRHLPSAPLRVVAALIYVAVPNSWETYVNLTNVQWHLGLLLVCLLLADPPRTAREAAGDLACLLLAAFTGPFAAMLAPWALLRAYEERRSPGKRWSLVLLAVFGAAAVVQTGIALASRTPVPAGPLSPRETLAIISVHAFWNTVLGLVGMWRYGKNLGFGAHLAGLAALTLLALFVIARRNRPLLVLLYLASTTVALSFLSPLNPLRNWLRSEYAPRYYLFGALFVCYATVLLCCEKGRLRWAGIPVAVACLAMGFRLDFALPQVEDTLWRDQVAVFESLPHGSSYYFPTRPEEWGFRLQKRSTRQGPSPLAGLRREEGAPRCVVDPVRIRWLPDDDRLKVSITGWALDDASGRAARKVYVLVDDGIYPAVMRQYRAGMAERAGFTRFIPSEDVGPGRHLLAIAVLSADGRSYRLSSRQAFVNR